MLLGAIGAGAVCGTFELPAAAKLGADRVMTGATLGTALALVLFAIAREPATGLISCVLAGISWVAAIATLNVSAQFALPGWVRGRGMAMFATAQFAGLPSAASSGGRRRRGSALRPFTLSRRSRWSPRSHCCGAGGFRPPPVSISLRRCMARSVALTRHRADRGPVLVTIEYVVPRSQRRDFSRRWRSWRASAGETALSTGASTKTPRKRCLRRDILRRFLARPHATASTRDQCRLGAAGRGAQLPRGRHARGQAFDRGTRERKGMIGSTGS